MKQPSEDLFEQATDVFGDEGKAEEWLLTPAKALDGESPVSKHQSVDGLEEVTAILRKIESGEFT